MAGESAVYPNALPLGSMLMEYRLESVLGIGGFGITYLASDTLLEKKVAIKEYFPGAAVSRGSDLRVTLTQPDTAAEYEMGLDRFLKEARTLAGFSHPNIVRVNRYFKEHGTGYMVMDYEHGESLKSWLKKNPQPPLEGVLGFLAPLLDGIAKVHAAGFLHRDIKPDNIYVRQDGAPVLIDFGSARQALGGTQTLTTLVTPGYAPFEQYSSGVEQGPWTDLYAMGGVLYYSLTGHNPPDAIGRMKGDSLPQLLAPAAPRYGEPLIEAIEWAMQIDEKKRPKTVAEWREKIFGPPPDPTLSFSGQVPRSVTQLLDARFGSAGMATPVTAPPMTTSPPRTTGGPAVTSPEIVTSHDTSDIGHLLEKREQLDRAMKEKFQRVLTVMFTDLKGSTALAEQAGDLEVRALLKVYHDLCIESVRGNGGTLVKTIGDGSLSHFTDALAACRAAAAIQLGMEKLNLSRQFASIVLVRVGLHTGECILEKNDVFGDVVNTASRFESSANPGEILISEETYNAMSSHTEFYARFDRNVTLKGKALPFKAYIVFWDPKEIEIDRARPAAAARPSTPVWKIATWIGVPLLVVLAAAVWITQSGKIGETTRSINYSVPAK